MNKIFYLIFCVTMMMIFTACGDNTATRIDSGSVGVADVLQSGMEASEDRNDEKENGIGVPPVPDLKVKEPTDPVDDAIDNDEAEADVDLTALSSTMIYSEVYNMMVAPNDYIGKTIKMAGMYSQYYDEQNDKYYFACIIKDATACCAQGIEFVLKDEYSFPADYPSDGDYVTVEGVFDTYMEGNDKYCTLRDAILL
ncbi:MAG: hypothetical protein K6E68_04880 [Lachnospiraceae bacterium]|nr:hypothetical protein [Lachnospiraceae bacterium]